jgi:type III secretion protein J
MRRLALMLCLLFATAGCRAQVQHGLEEKDANEIVSVLAMRGFDVAKLPEKGRKPTWAIEVNKNQASDATRVLTELKLPRPPRASTRELVSQPGLVETPTAERARQLEGVEGDLELALESLDGVASAAVELAVPLAPPRAGQAPAPTRASVLLRVQPDAQVRLTEQRDALRGLVAGAVEGLKIDDVTLFIDSTVPHSPTLVQTIGPPRSLVWALLVAMLLFAGGFIYLLLRQAFGPSAATAKAKKAAKSSNAAEPTPPQVPAPILSRTFIRAPQRAA